MKLKSKITATLLAIFAACSTAFAQDYISIAKNGNIYDEASTKYITINQNNDDIAVVPGMVFATSQHTPGWYKIEYSPGLHAFIPEQIVASNFKTVQPGSYDISNNSGQKLNASKEGDSWTATVDGKTYNGKQSQDIIVFLDSNNKPAFSLVNLGNGPIAITYANSVTKFF